MNQNKEQSFKEKIVTNLDNFFRTKKVILWSVAISFLCLILFFYIWNLNTNRILDESTQKVEDVQENYSKWTNETDTTKKSELESKLIEDLSAIIKKYSKGYSAQRALFIRGVFYIKKTEWEKEANDYSQLFRSFPTSILAEESILNAASCYEELSNYNEAIKLHKEFQVAFKNSSKMAYSLFSVGRLYEQMNNYTEAGKIYEKLETDFSASGWTKLSQNRLIYLKANSLYNNQ